MREKRILVIKLNRLGDTIAFLPAINAIRRGLPEAHVTLLTTDTGKEIIEGTTLVDRIWVSTIEEVKTPAGFLKWLKLIRKERFDCAIASSDNSSFIALLFLMSAIPVRIGFTNPKLSILYNVRIPFRAGLSHLELNLSIAERLGCPVDHRRPRIDVSNKDKDAALRLLEENGIKESNRFIIIHLGSNKLAMPQRWPLKQFSDLFGYLSEKYAVKIVFIGGNGEKNLIPLSHEQNLKKYFVDLTGKTNLRQLIHLISMANLFIGHPSGPLQIAYMVGTPSVSLWGASSFVDWGPAWDKERHVCIHADLDCIGCEQKTCPKGTFECMGLITTDMVEKEVSKMLLTRSLA